MKTYEDAIKKIGWLLKTIRWSIESSADDDISEYGVLEGEVTMLAFLTGKDEEDIYRDVKEVANN